MATLIPEFGLLDLEGLLPAVHGGGHDDGGLVTLVDELLTRASDDAPSAWHLLGGLETLGTNVHPVLLHFPIAFLVGYLITELYGLVFGKPGSRQLASGLLYLGAFAAVVTVVSGLLAAEQVPHGAEVHEIMEWHQRAGITVATLSSLLAIWRGIGGIPSSVMAISLSLMVSLVISGVLFLGADMGGEMVYKHGVGVHGLQSTAEHQHHTHSAPNGEQSDVP